MRLQEFISPEEWQQLEQLIYATTWRALSTYQQQRASQQRISSRAAATLKPQVAKKAKALARKATHRPHAAPPRPLPKPQNVPPAKAEATPAYRPVKTVKQLPPSTRAVLAKSQPLPKSTAPSPVMNFGNVDQAARRWLPPDKRGPNDIDLISP